MSFFEAVILGLVQGLTEFLPISSSGHLRVVSAFFGWPDPGAAFTAVSQIGTELAVVIYFRKRIWAILSTWTRSLFNRELRSDVNARMGWYVILGSIPIVVLGLLLEEQIESVFRDLRLIALNLIIFGVILGIVDRYSRKHRTLEDLNVPRGLTFGLFQALALIPGVSRSGGTLTGGMLLGFKRAEAAEYAFLLALPAVFGAGVYQLTDIGGDEYAGWGATIVGTVIAGVVGFVVIAWLMRFISTHSFMPFVYYRVGLGILVLALVSWDVIDPQGGAGSEVARSEVVSVEETTGEGSGTESGSGTEPDSEATPGTEPASESGAGSDASTETSGTPGTPSESPSPTIDPVTGWEIDPEVGLPRNPETGLYHDPDLGMDVDYDPATGLATNPITGQTYDPQADD